MTTNAKHTLDGTWQVTSLEVEGGAMPEESLAGARITVAGDRFSTAGMGQEFAGTLTLDLGAKPKRLDIHYTEGPHAGLTSLGIFMLDDAVWTLCLGMAGGIRPRKFATAPGSGHALEVLHRVGAGDEASARAPQRPDRTPSPAAVKPVSPKPPRSTAAVSADAALHGGDWAMVSLDQSGKPMIPAAYLSFGRRVVRGNSMRITMNGVVMLDVTFEVDATTTPKSIDYTLRRGAQQGKKQLGIFELTGDDSRYCMAAPGDPRPAEFVTAAGDGRTLSAWKRLKS